MRYLLFILLQICTVCLAFYPVPTAMPYADAFIHSHPHAKIDVHQAMESLHRQIITTADTSIVVNRELLLVVELFECVGDMSINLVIKSDSVISRESASQILLWYNYNNEFITDTMSSNFFTILDDYNRKPGTGQWTYGGRLIDHGIMHKLSKLQEQFFFRKYNCFTTLTYLTSETLIPERGNPFIAPRDLGWAKTADQRAIVDTLDIESHFAKYDQILSNLTIESFNSEQQSIEIASLIGCLRNFTDCPVFLRGVPSLYSTNIHGYSYLAIDSQLLYSSNRRASDEALHLFSIWYKANRGFITESMIKRCAQYIWCRSYCETLLETDPLADTTYILNQAWEMVDLLSYEYFCKKYLNYKI